MNLLAFCWASPQVIDYYLRLTGYLSERGPASACFVTPDPYGKLLLRQRQAEAFTIGELHAVTGQAPAPEVSDPELDRLTALDRLWGYTWLPRQGSPFPDAGRLTEYYRWSARRILAAYAFLFDALQPQAVLTWNGASFLAQAPAYLAARRGIPRFFLERGLLPDTLTVDPEGVNYGSRLAGPRWGRLPVPEPAPEEIQTLRRYCRELQRQGRTIVPAGQTVSPEAARRKLDIPPKARVVLFPLQLERDSNLINFSPHYQTMPAIIRDLQQALQDFPDVYLIAKPHPEDKNRLAELQALCGPRTRLSADLSLASLLSLADVVATVNSTVGLEALVQQKPVVVLGQAIYGEKGFTFDLDDPTRLSEKLGQALAAVQAGGENHPAFDRFLVDLLKHGLFPLSGPDPWNSRERIAQIILSAAAAVAPGVPPASPLLARLRQHDRELHTLLQGASSILLLGPPDGVADLLAKAVPGARLEVLNRLTPRRRLPGCLAASYDLALTFGYPRFPRRLLWPLVRAKRKLHLI